MKILQVTTRGDHIGGSHIHIRDLVGYLKESGCDVGVASGPGDEFSHILSSLEVPQFIVPSLTHSPNPRKDFEALTQLCALISSFQPDLVACHSSKAGLLGRLAARLKKVPYCFTAHGWGFAPGVPKFQKALAWLSEQIVSNGQVICVSDYDKSLAIDTNIRFAHHHSVIHNGCGPAKLLSDPLNNRDFAMVARFDRQKDQIGLLEAMCFSIRPWRVHFVGDGPLLDRCKDVATQLQLQERTIFHGRLSDVSPILSAVGGFVLWSHWEGFPISTLEAMSSGLPCVVSDVGGASEAIVNGKTGFSIRRDDSAGLIEVLDLLHDNDQLRCSLGLAAKRMFESKFTLAEQFSKTVSFYNSILASDTTK